MSEIQQLISTLRNRKNPLTEEKEELKDLLDMILDHETAQAINQSEAGVKRSRRNKMLSDKVIILYRQLFEIQFSVPKIRIFFSKCNAHDSEVDKLQFVVLTTLPTGGDNADKV